MAVKRLEQDHAMGAGMRLAGAGLSLWMMFAGCNCSTPEQGKRGAGKTRRAPPVEQSSDEDVQAVIDNVHALELARAPAANFAQALAHEEHVVRRAAARALARGEYLDAAGPLIAALKDPAPGVRTWAAFGLGQLDRALEDAVDGPRGAIETALIAVAETDPDPAVRAGAIRALGRVAQGAGLSALVKLGDDPDATLAEHALTALGVAGKRRPPKRPRPDVIAVVHRGLKSSDMGRRRGAAYAALRRKVPLPDAVLAGVGRIPDVQTRVHLARALGKSKRHQQAARTLLADPDWRVVVEAVAAVRKAPALAVDALVQTLDTRTKRLAQSPAEAHPVEALCAALINAPRAKTRPVLRHTVQTLKSTRPDVACACAVALDAQDAKLSHIKTCADNLTEEEQGLLAVDVVRQANLAREERARWLATAFSDDSRLVRRKAAEALGGLSAEDARAQAQRALSKEQDPGVVAALLAVFTDAPEKMSTRLLYAAVDRFETATTFEDAEPLLTALTLAKARDPEGALGLYDRLAEHAVPQVRREASARGHGERLPRVVAQTMAWPDTETLPGEAVLRTERGDIKLRLFAGTAPLTVDNFVRLARRGFYDGTGFHRVVPDFVAQGGDPRGDGSGGPGYTIPCENSDLTYSRGTVGMALAGKDTGGSQFFITHSDQPHLDGGYTVFAEVVEGMAVVDALLPRDAILSVKFASHEKP